MAVTIQDVAHRAQVSILTVSRVLNGTARVREDKRVRVEEAVQALGYAPNPNAQSLLKHKTGGIGVILPYVTGEFFSDLLMGIDKTAQDNGYFLLISTSHRDEGDIKRALRTMYKRVDGLLIMAPEIEEDLVQHITGQDTPVVFMNTQTGSITSDVVLFDNFQAFYDITAYVLGLGHRRLAVIKGPPNAYDAQERLRGFHAAIDGFGRADVQVVEIGEEVIQDQVLDAYSLEAGYWAGREIAKMTPRPTVVLAPNDQNAIGVLHAFHEVGLRVPDDISVTGFDNVTNARYAIPALTTVGVHVRQMGTTAAERLLQQMEDRITTSSFAYTLESELVVRNSTSAPST